MKQLSGLLFSLALSSYDGSSEVMEMFFKFKKMCLWYVNR